MSDARKKLQHELETAQRALAEAEARFARMEAEHQAAAKEFENIRKQIVRAHQEWMTSLDVVADPIFLHDRNFHILRCNRAYQRYAGIPYKQIIGQPYYEVFPKTHAPLPNCLQAMGNLETDEHIADAETVVGDTTYRSRAYAVTDKQGSYLYSIHTLEDINEQLRSKRELKESELQYRRLFESAKDGILILDAETGKIIDANPFILNLLTYSLEELTGKILWEIGLFADIEASKRASKELLFREYIRYEDMPLQSKDGRRVEVEFVSNLYEVGERKVIQCNIRDITERRQAEQELLESERRFSDLLGNVELISMMLDRDGRLTYCNEYLLRLTGWQHEEVIGKNWFELFVPSEIQELKDGFFAALLANQPDARHHENEILTRSGEHRLIHWNNTVLRSGSGDVIGAASIGEDITEHKRAEAKSRDSERAYRTLTQNLPGLAYRVFIRENCRMVFYNDKLVQITGYREEELPSGTISSIELLILEEDRPGVEAEVKRAVAEQRPFTVEYRLRHKNGSILWMAEYGMPIYGSDDAPLYLDGVIYDVTQGKQAEQAIRQAEEKFRALVETTSDWIWELDRQGRYTYASPRVEILLGYQPQEVLGKSPLDFMPPQEARRVSKELGERIKQRAPITALGNTNLHKDGSLRVLETSGVPVFDESGEFTGYRGIDRDITDRKQAEEALGRANRALRTLSAGNEVLVRATSEDQLLQTAVNIIVEQSGYELAEVCYAEDNPEKSITLMAWSGMDEKFFWVGHPSWADTEEGQLPIASAIRSGMTQIRRDIAAESKYKPWRDEALARGHVSNIALPFVENGRTFGALSIYSSDAKTFDEEEVRLLEELANDLAYGVATLRTRLAHDQQAAILLESMEQSIQTVAYTVEARDPYTAGHQRRVAELATAIAQEMGLTEDQVNATHLAAIIHDLGKIRVPAEILSKPGKLTEIEFMLIKTHPQAGYDILKNVKFPWPIADIILQHHEKLDGTGYPQGLKGEQILIESRIMSVADVVEAMSSHRPYRAALGIEPALNEIKRGRGIAYDAAVVDACQRLFAEKRVELGTQ